MFAMLISTDNFKDKAMDMETETNTDTDMDPELDNVKGYH
jgi:hypothetical protein